MPGKIQTPVTNVRLNNVPLDESLTFDSLLDARKYAAGLDNTKGTPYNGQIISVNNICGSTNVCGTFKLESNNSGASSGIIFGHFKLVLLEAKRLDTGDVVTQENLIIIKCNTRYWLLVLRQIIKNSNGVLLLDANSAIKSSDDVLLKNDDFNYSILGLVDIFRSRSDMTIFAAYFNSGSYNGYENFHKIIDKNEIIGTQPINMYIMLSENAAHGLSINNDNTLITYNGITTPSNNVAEVYIDITDYLAGSVVK